MATGEGLASDQTALLQFGLGKETIVNKVTVRLANGKEFSVDNAKINSLLDLKTQVITNSLVTEEEIIETK